MGSAAELYHAIEAGDTLALGRILDGDPELVEGAGGTSPPVHWAIFHDQAAVVEILVGRGADIERRDQDRDSTALAYATSQFAEVAKQPPPT